MNSQLPAEEIVSQRVAGATYAAIATLHGISISKARYICRRAAMAGKVTPKQIGWRRIPKSFRIAPEVYDEHWTKRVMARVKQDENGCWIWQGSQHGKGYGQTAYRGLTVRIHRKLYEITRGVRLKPETLVCHTCDVRQCCNPTHLFIGTAKDNNQDCGRKGRHHNSVKTHCKRGHPYDEANTYITPEGLRNCKVCSRARMRIAAGWPKELAYSMDPVPSGQRPVNAKYKKTRKAA